MGIVTIGQVIKAKARAQRGTSKNISSILRESRYRHFSHKKYDIFLCHSKMDEGYVLGARQILEEKGFSVYVDWVDDPFLDRSNVNKETAEQLRNRMKACATLFYLHSNSSTTSKWCPWELGFFDGLTKSSDKVFVFPIVFSDETYKGQEYLNLYPTIDIDDVGKVNESRKDIWRHDPSNERNYRRLVDVL